MSERLTLQDLVDLLSDKQGVTKKDAENFIRELVDLTIETISQKDFVRIKDFGTYKLTPVKARRSVDVNTGEAIEISAHYKLSFTPDKVLREAVNRPFSHFESILVEEDVAFEDKAEESPKKKTEKEEKNIKKEAPVAKAAAVTAPIAVEPVEEKTEPVVVDDIVEAVAEEPQVANTIALEKEEVSEKPVEVADKESQADVVVSQPEAVATPPVEEKVETRQIREEEEEEDDDWDDSYYEEEKKKRNIKIGIGVLVAVLLLIGYWGYTSYGEKEPADVAVAQNNSSVTISDDAGGESIENGASGALPDGNQPTDEGTQQPAETTNTQSAVNEQAAVEVEVEAGQTMRTLGEKYYGNRAFWVYIFEENRETISRPDAIFAGMKIIIPPASKYEIDPDDRTSVRKAERLEMKLFGEFSDN